MGERERHTPSAMLNWTQPVSLISKPKGASKQAADARLQQYKSLILSTLQPNEETKLRQLACSTTPASQAKLYGKGASAARRARRQNEMAEAAASLLTSDGAPALGAPLSQQQHLGFNALQATAPTAPAQLSLHITALQQQVNALTQQLAVAAAVKPEQAHQLALDAATAAAPAGAQPGATELSRRVAQMAQLVELQKLQWSQQLTELFSSAPDDVHDEPRQQAAAAAVQQEEAAVAALLGLAPRAFASSGSDTESPSPSPTHQ
uniref:Uncharacterized protein n=1 Tax=Prymnesium polylepis TaxID=72548 RepID=A0A7S4II62_9EUKA